MADGQRDTRKTKAEMAGDFLREAAVLVGPLGLLEKFVNDGSIGWWYAAGVGAVCTACLLAGMSIERKR